MRKFLALLAILALSISGSASATWPTIAEGWHKIEDPATTYASIPAPAGCIPGSVPVFNASTDIDCDAYLNYTAATRTLAVTGGTVTASNLTAIALATPVIASVTPILSQVGTITTVAAGWRASGLLTVVEGSLLLDGETFVLNDGVNVPQSFEFDVAGDGVVGGHVEIDIAGTETAPEVAALCVAAIDATTSATFTYDAVDNLDGTVTLQNTTWAAAGNAAQSETVADAGFSVTAMTGGVDAGIIDGDYLTIKYDGGVVPLEFDTGDGTTGGRIPVVFTGTETADDVRDLLIAALNAAVPTALTASSGGAATVAIVLDTPGAAGDTNTENVANAGFAVTGMADPTAATTYTYKLVARLADGSTTEAGAASTTAAGHATLSASNYNALSWSAVSGAASYDVYKTVGGTTGKIAAATTALSLNDTGLAGGGETAPTVDGTGVVTAGRVGLANAGTVTWGTDIGLARSSAGVLKVTDGSTGAGSILVADGTAAAPSVAFANYPATGFYAGASQYYILGATGGFNVVSFSTPVSVGIPSTSYLAWSSTNYSYENPNTYLSSPAAATLQLGAAASATPVAQTLQAQGSTGTNISGADFTVSAGKGTGLANTTAAGRRGDLKLRTQVRGSTGTTADTVGTDRAVFAGQVVTLTESSATPVLDYAVASGSVAGGTLYYTIRADDATDFQVIRGSVPFVTVNKGGTLTVTLGTPVEVVAVSAGTLTNTVTLTTGTNEITLNLNAVSSLTQTTLYAYVSAQLDGAGVADTK